MRFLAIIVNYIVWHYTRAILEFSHIYKNILSFVFNFFSIPILIQSYFAPWRRMGEDYTKNFLDDPEDTLAVFIVNIIMRIVGIVMRTIIIVGGLILCFFVAIFYPILLILWLALPLILVILVMLGFGLLSR